MTGSRSGSAPTDPRYAHAVHAGEVVGAPSVVLGLSFDFHDAAAAVVIDGRVAAAAEEERFSRRKADPRLPEAATRSCLEVAGIGAADITHVVFYEKPLLVASRFLSTRQRQGLRSLGSFTRDAPAVFGRNLMVGYRVGRMLQRLGAPHPPPLQYTEHHISHAASAFFPSPFEEAAVLTVDGIGEWATATIGLGQHHRLAILEELRFPDSLGLSYSFITAFCGFRPNEDEYKVMGLAPYGTPRFLEQLSTLVDLRADGSIGVDAKALGWYSPKALHRSKLAELFEGPPRRAGDPISQRDADLAASVQRLAELAMLGLAGRASELTGSANLCLAGGVALNGVANGRIQREGAFESVWVQPAAGDAGGAVGAALAHWHLVLGNRRSVRHHGDGGDGMSGAALGPRLGADEVRLALEAAGIVFAVVDDADERAQLVARRLAAGAIVGWVEGRMEFGPRALGHRSLLADPRDPDARQRLNRVVKGREDFRPFAPAVLAERAHEWFDLEGCSPYMSSVAPVRADRLVTVDHEPDGIAERAMVVRSTIPACTHIDGTARVQTVDRARHPEFHRLLRAFEDLTGCPILVNTSFNRAGEPIVGSASDAVATALAGGIDVLVFDGVVADLAAVRA
ncbi:MAG: novN [Acidimicrobiales bacterium]|nr:novN [Acidimicrobiales bacterium]